MMLTSAAFLLIQAVIGGSLMMPLKSRRNKAVM
jgi:hypothetical protein